MLDGFSATENKDVAQTHFPAAISDRPNQLCVGQAIQRTCTWLLDHQHEAGYWCGELEGDTILESEYILLLAWLGREQSEVAKKAANYILQQQLPGGGWAMYPGGDVDISGSVKAYFALKLTGHSPAAEYMQRARDAIIEHGGADAVNSFTRFYLALLGQISYDHCPAVPPEAVLLPAWFPLSIYRISAWSRTILVPLAIMWAHRPSRQLNAHQGIQELFLRLPKDWPALHCPGLKGNRRWFCWERTFRQLDRMLKLMERLRLRPFRRLALKRAERWTLDRFENSDGLGAIFPPIVWSVVALRSLGYAEDSPEVVECLMQLESLIIEENATVRLQPCKSPVWDTAISLRALAAAGASAEDTAIQQAIQWLLQKEVRRAGDWRKTVEAEPAGWFFEHNNDFYPDVDDTIMVMMALREQTAESDSSLGPSTRAETRAGCSGQEAQATAVQAACDRGKQWLLAMQNRDGGWGAFDKDNDAEFLCHVPFADHNAMIDPSTPDIAARVLECLAQLEMSLGDEPIDRAVKYIRDTQLADGSWYGRWGVNYIYGTWQVLVGLSAIGAPKDDPAMERGAKWLIDHQQACGGWGESADSYADPSLAGIGPVTPSQTSWALLGLMAAGKTHDPAVAKGIQYLVETQQHDGSWHETEFTGTGFPLVFYLRYHMYPNYFPLLALATWERSVRGICH